MQLQLEITKQSSSYSSSSTTITPQQTQKLRSKVIKLQSTNADLTSQLQSHQSEVDTLTTKMESYQKSLTERTVETEREKRKADKLASEFDLMEQSYQKHVSKSSMEQKALKSDIRRLQDQITKLSSQSGLQDLQEMEEIRRKYTKMSQDVHSLRIENTRLTKRLEDERAAVWRRDLLGREKGKGKQMMSEMVTMQSSSLSELTAVAGGSSDSGGLARSTGSQNKSIKSRKISLDGRGRDQQASSTTSRQKMTSVSTSASTTTSSFDLAAFPPPRSKSKDHLPNKSKAMDILDKTRSRKHSLQQNSLLMSVKRTKTTSFAKGKAPRKSNVSVSAAEVVHPRAGVHSFFRRNEER
jgi:regulator of replication initiation timing